MYFQFEEIEIENSVNYHYLLCALLQMRSSMGTFTDRWNPENFTQNYDFPTHSEAKLATCIINEAIYQSNCHFPRLRLALYINNPKQNA